MKFSTKGYGRIYVEKQEDIQKVEIVTVDDGMVYFRKYEPEKVGGVI